MAISLSRCKLAVPSNRFSSETKEARMVDTSGLFAFNTLSFSPLLSIATFGFFDYKITLNAKRRL
ncbi:MAG: hypothetical protein C0424_10395 [Sphingobacteriaceae bacterium]|nr:hypothetical protein [Sphingobacteriaceae bacterium]